MKSKFVFLDARTAVVEAILAMDKTRFTKRDIWEEVYRKLALNTVGVQLSELKYYGLLTGERKGNSYFYTIVDRDKFRPHRPHVMHGITKEFRTPSDSEYTCLYCEGTTVDIEASNMRGRPLLCEECNGQGFIDWIKKITL